MQCLIRLMMRMRELEKDPFRRFASLLSMKFLVRGIAQALLMIVCVGSLAVAQQKATVVGRFRIRNPNGNYYGKTKTLVFLDAFNHKHSCNIKRKDSGYFSIQLPLWHNYLTYVHYSDQGDYEKKLPEKYVELTLDSVGRIYYIGDIVMNWDVELKDEIKITFVGLGLVFGIIGSVADAM